MQKIRWGLIGCGLFFDLASHQNDEGEQSFAIAPPEHIQQPLIQTMVDALLGRGTRPSSGESGARTNRIMDQIIYGP